MKLNHIEPIIVNILLSSVLLLVFTVVVILALKYKKYHSRPYLLSCLLFLFQFFGIGGFLLISIINGNVEAPFDTVLRPATLITGFTTIIFLLAYIIDIKLPGKLNQKNLLIGISPFVITSAFLLMAQPSTLHHAREVLDNVSSPDVWLRLVILFFYIAYPIVVVCIPYEWRRCMVSRKMILWIQGLTCIIPPVFIAGMLCGFFPAIIINYIVAIILDTLIAYIELKERIQVHKPILDSVTKQQDDYSFLENSEIWMNPDLTAAGLATIMGTNHTYLSRKIKELGYSSFTDMINRKRIEYICKGLEKGADVDIISLMFEAGFRSRSTASREFKRIVGCSPSEYLKCGPTSSQPR